MLSIFPQPATVKFVGHEPGVPFTHSETPVIEAVPISTVDICETTNIKETCTSHPRYNLAAFCKKCNTLVCR